MSKYNGQDGDTSSAALMANIAQQVIAALVKSNKLLKVSQETPLSNQVGCDLCRGGELA